VVIIVVGFIMYWFYLRQTKVAQASGKSSVAKGSAT